jgi:outer membrane protein OmpA-like peptidoglycan-associated protein
MELAAVFFAAVLLLANLGPTKTTVILLPDEDGKVGAVTVSTEGDSRVIDQAFNSVTTGGGAGKLPATQALGEERVQAEYADLLSAQPPKPESFLLYFGFDSTSLTEASLATIAEIADKIKARMPTEILLVGHSDATGSDAINMVLSRERAVAVENLLKDRIPSLERVDIRFFGAKEPLIQTPPGVPEPRNRRVEVIVH